MRGIDHNQIGACIHELFGARKTGVADGGGRRHPQTPLLVLGRMGIEPRLFYVLDGDEADAEIIVIDHHQLLDAVLMEQLFGFLHADIFFYRYQIFAGHQLRDRLRGICREAHIAVGEDAHQLALARAIL